MLGCTWAHLAYSIHTPLLAQMETNIQAETEVIQKTMVHSNQPRHAQCLDRGGAQPISPVSKQYRQLYLCVTIL